MLWVYNDGGRAAAGFKGDAAGDCACRAVAIASKQPYLDVYTELATFCSTERRSKRRGSQSHPRTGIYGRTVRTYLERRGWKWVPTMGIGTGCRVHLKSGELPAGRLIVRLSKHYVAVIDGIIHDNHDCSRGGSRCVYGFFHSTRMKSPPALQQK